MTLSALREAISLLECGLGTEKEEPLRTYKLARYMDMLGHCEYFSRPRPSTLLTAASCLVKLPQFDRHSFVLCGMRSASSAEEIRFAAAELRMPVEIAISSRRNFPERLLPDRITLTFQDPNDAARIASALQIGFDNNPASWVLACFSCDVEIFEASLSWRPRTLRDSELRFYAPGTSVFNPGTLEQCGPCLAQRADDPSWACLLRDNQEAVVEDLDWARFWAHREAGISCLAYDASRKLFAVPTRIPLPRILARALCLCSGNAPMTENLGHFSRTSEVALFRDVPKEVAFKIADKLGSTLVPKTITSIEECD